MKKAVSELPITLSQRQHATNNPALHHAFVPHDPSNRARNALRLQYPLVDTMPPHNDRTTNALPACSAPLAIIQRQLFTRTQLLAPSSRRYLPLLRLLLLAPVLGERRPTRCPHRRCVLA